MAKAKCGMVCTICYCLFLKRARVLPYIGISLIVLIGELNSSDTGSIAAPGKMYRMGVSGGRKLTFFASYPFALFEYLLGVFTTLKHTLPYVKQIANGNLLYGSGNSNRGCIST